MADQIKRDGKLTLIRCPDCGFHSEALSPTAQSKPPANADAPEPSHTCPQCQKTGELPEFEIVYAMAEGE